jgi:hypothetical protein
VGVPFIAGGGESGAAARLWVAWWCQRSHGHGKAVVAVVGMSSARFGRRRPGSETNGWAPRGFDFFQFIQNWLNFKNSKWVPYLAPKIPNFCMWLASYIMNNFLNCADIQFPT